MRIESVRLAGFRCFGPEPISISLSSHVTAIVGPNAAGKTALLQALVRLFGVSRAQRTVLRSDFHVGAEEDLESRQPKQLFIEVLVGFPELRLGQATAETIAPCFRRMLITREGEAPVCRIRLSASWEDDGTVEGEVSQEMFWLDSLIDEPEEDARHPVSAADRGLIQLYYTPASRDPAAQVKATAGALAARLLRAIEWSSEAEGAVETAAADLSKAFGDEPAIVAIGDALRKRWADLYDDEVDTKPRLSLVSRRFEEVINKITVLFEQGADGRERSLDVLSDGQKSLFYFALAAAVFDLERQVVKGKVTGFGEGRLRIPALSIFALEEPENHLSPYFLARIIEQVRSLTIADGGQALITSHSPAVLSRVEPSEVRYCRQDPRTRISTVRSIRLPQEADEASKFVRGALLAYPELYFARFVLLVEGDSERIVLPTLAKAINLFIDPAFVAIVPLGGRHVQHFWFLLKQLEIPHATLLDLDLGRSGGGFGRIKTTIEKLIQFGTSRSALLSNDQGEMPEEAFAEMHTWEDPQSMGYLPGWTEFLERFGVYFCAPLDLDLAMLEAFPKAYEAIVPPGGGSRMTLEKASEAALGEAGPGMGLYATHYATYPARFPAYRYHFLTHSKPVTHLAAMANLEDGELAQQMPATLKRLLEHVQASLRQG